MTADGTTRSPCSDHVIGLFWFVIGLSALTGLFAAFHARGLIYDGSYYFLSSLEKEGFCLWEPARKSVEILQQSFLVAGEEFGIRDLNTLARLQSLGMYLWPVLLSAACWFALPPGQKSWIVGPLLNVVAVIPTTNLVGIGEGVIASALMWLLALLVMFRMDSIGSAVAAVVLAFVCVWSHEAAFIFMFGIAGLALWRMRKSPQFERVTLAIVAFVSTIAAVNLTRFVLLPRSTGERADFLVSSLGKFLGLVPPNFPAWCSLAAALALVLVLSPGSDTDRKKLRARIGIFFALAIYAFAVLAITSHPDAMVAPGLYFAARGLPVLVTTMLALAGFLVWRSGMQPGDFACAPVIVVLACLALTQAVMDITMTLRWAAFTTDIKTLVTTRKGIVSFETAASALAPDGARFRQKLVVLWCMEPLSIALAPNGHVQAVVAPNPSLRWVPYALNVPHTLPKTPELDWSSFVGEKQ